MAPKGKKDSHQLGRTVIKSRLSQQRQGPKGTGQHTVGMQDGPAWSNMRSIVEQSDLDELLQVAQLAGTDFAAERASPVIVGERGVARLEGKEAPLGGDRPKWLRIPRRPRWGEQMSAEDLHRLEQEAFLEWRRELARFEDAGHFILTPFERNLEMWRQLWRVIEQSGLVVQIVDARNPLLFHCPDLEVYAKEADLLSEEQRAQWADYLERAGIQYVFYSAHLAASEALAQDGEGGEGGEEGSEESEQGSEKSIEESEEGEEGDEKSEEGSEESQDGSEQSEYGEELSDSHIDQPSDSDIDQPPNPHTHQSSNPHAHQSSSKGMIQGRWELLHLLRTLSDGQVVGMVGYPNVGKSSTINSLAGVKRVAVAATPGKTKHFQTVSLENGVVLFDCPGLVFPNFAVSKADLVLNGILPIDQMREWIEPAELLVKRIPRDIIERTFGIELPKPKEEEEEDQEHAVTASQLLSSYAIARGFRTSFHGNPDEARAARIIFKEYVSGKLVFCTPPPHLPDPILFNAPIWDQLRQQLPTKLHRLPNPNKHTSVDPNLQADQHHSYHLSGTSGTRQHRLAQEAALAAAATRGKKHYKMYKRR